MNLWSLPARGPFHSICLVGCPGLPQAIDLLPFLGFGRVVGSRSTGSLSVAGRTLLPGLDDRRRLWEHLGLSYPWMLGLCESDSYPGLNDPSYLDNCLEWGCLLSRWGILWLFAPGLETSTPLGVELGMDFGGMIGMSDSIRGASLTPETGAPCFRKSN